MKTLYFFFSMAAVSIGYAGTAQEAYVQRFMTYQEWSQQLPEEPTQDFFNFIKLDAPLSKKLRERWLYKLASQKDWANYSQYYQPSTDENLQCFALQADYAQGKIKPVLEQAKTLWLNADSLPKACNTIIDALLKSQDFDETLISQRIRLALDKRNFSLARHLLKTYKKPRLQDEKILVSIYQSPTRITQLQTGELHDDFYLYGLKRLVSTNMEQALAFFKHVQTKKLLNYPQQQSFLAHVALYKAMRNHEDAALWFRKINPAHYNDVLLDWRIRFALKQEDWKTVEALIHRSPQKDSACWQYWLARSKEAQGQSDDAKIIYSTLATTRNYYGFLASLRLNQQLSFQNEQAVTNTSILKPYQAILENIKSLYLSKQTLPAFRLLNDFISELPKIDKSAVLYWVSHDLQWHSKSLYLSNTDELTNQLSLRFPLAHTQAIKSYGKNYQIPSEYIYAIIRQESSFREDVVSPVGARGLMQLMPATATMVAKKEHIAYRDKEQLFLTEKNINLGVAYLQQLGKRFNQHPILMAAAYNAGPRQVNFWLHNHPPKEMDIWIETLPWHETRNYLKNVMAFFAVYQYRMKQKPNLSSFLKPVS